MRAYYSACILDSFLKDLFLFLVRCLCACLYESICRRGRMVWDPLGLERHALVSCEVWGLGAKPGSSTRALDHAPTTAELFLQSPFL